MKVFPQAKNRNVEKNRPIKAERFVKIAERYINDGELSSGKALGNGSRYSSTLKVRDERRMLR